MRANQLFFGSGGVRVGVPLYADQDGRRVWFPGEAQTQALLEIPEVEEICYNVTGYYMVLHLASVGQLEAEVKRVLTQVRSALLTLEWNYPKAFPFKSDAPEGELYHGRWGVKNVCGEELIEPDCPEQDARLLAEVVNAVGSAELLELRYELDHRGKGLLEPWGELPGALPESV